MESSKQAIQPIPELIDSLLKVIPQEYRSLIHDLKGLQQVSKMATNIREECYFLSSICSAFIEHAPSGPMSLLEPWVVTCRQLLHQATEVREQKLQADKQQALLAAVDPKSPVGQLIAYLKRNQVKGTVLDLVTNTVPSEDVVTATLVIPQEGGGQVDLVLSTVNRQLCRAFPGLEKFWVDFLSDLIQHVPKSIGYGIQSAETYPLESEPAPEAN
jgi:hypothetical protein